MMNRPMQNSTKKEVQGFTLVELLIAMVISLVVIGSLSGTFIFQRKTYDVQEQITEMQQTARAAMDMISREVKMAGYDPSYPKVFSILSANFGIPYSATQLAIRADLNGDGDTSDTHENIIYTYDSTDKQIDRNTGGGAQPFAENIQSFTFQYYDIDGNTTTTDADIRQIDITITARTSNPDPDYGPNSGYRTYKLDSYVTPPNLDL